MRLSELRRAKIRTVDGQHLGRVHEVHSEGGVVTAVTCGAGSLIEQLTGTGRGRLIPWDFVRQFKDGVLTVTTNVPRRNSSGARTRKDTRQPSAPRSRR